MCAHGDKEALTKHVALGACFHVLKPLHTGSLNMLKQKALEHKSKKETPQGPIPSGTKSGMASSSTRRFQEMLIIERNNLSNAGSNEFEVPEVGKGQGCSKKPGRVKWTIELHEKFLDALEVLGDKCKGLTDATPVKILKLMNVKCLTSKQIASHLQKHRLHQRNAKEGGQSQKNASMKPVSELIGSAHNAATTESIAPGVDADIRAVYPLRLWKQVKEAAASNIGMYSRTSGNYKDGTKSVWDEYEKSLHKKFSASNRRWQQIGLSSSKHQFPVKNCVVIDGGISSEAPKAAGEIGYGASGESFGLSSLPTRLVAQIGENNRTETAGNNDNVGNINMLEGTMNKEHTAATDPDDVWGLIHSNDLDLTLPYNGMEEYISNWMCELQGSQDQQNLDEYLEDLLQVDNAQKTGLASTSPIDIDGSMAQEASAHNAPVDNPMTPNAQDDGLWDGFDVLF
ncbi:hypothetical protein HU200_051004 [Digitaria exilis]|uniref:HTH myb-type domain-containing protein n=1 Tax=Digitaria exilis TaxID=1010633 RepID=A0A835AQN3_9POAL|nr:hypothetical protein HU200_051004 [Digitaria exilis]